MIRRVDRGKSHHYEDDQGRVPGVTTILNSLPKDALVNWAARATAEYACDNWDTLTAMSPTARLRKLEKCRYEGVDRAKKRGIDVHKHAEALISGMTRDVPQHLLGYVEGYARWLDSSLVMRIETEQLVYHPEHRYAGTYDVLALLDDELWMLDIKTGKSVYRDTALQLAAYGQASTVDVDGVVWESERPQRYGVLHVAQGQTRLYPVDVTEDTFNAFLAVKTTHEWLAGPDPVGDWLPELPDVTRVWLVRS